METLSVKGRICYRSHCKTCGADRGFTYSSVNDKGFKKSWALNNLQPMWAKDNLKKHNKFSGGCYA